MLRILTLSPLAPSGGVREASIEELTKLVATEGRLVWVDLESPTPDEAAVLLRVFRFHPVAVEDALEDVVHPKVDDYGKYLYVVLHGVLHDTLPEDGTVMMHEVDFFLGRELVVTHHEGVSMSCNKVWERVRRTPELFLGGCDLIFAAIVEAMIDRYMPVIEAFDERVDEMEDDVFRGKADATVLEKIFAYKRTALKLRRSVHPAREVIRNLSVGQYSLVSKEAQILLRDTYDHLFTIAELIETYRDLLAGTLEAHVSVTSNRLNIVMKRLTVITTVLMVVSFLAGFYGMNFAHLPFADWKTGWLWMLVLMAASGAFTIWIMKRRRWI